jgi:hypothetical protein
MATPPALDGMTATISPCFESEGPSLAARGAVTNQQSGRTAGRRQAVILGLAGAVAVFVGAGGWILGRLSRGDRPTDATRDSQRTATSRDEAPPQPMRQPDIVTANASGELVFVLGAARLMGNVRLEVAADEERLTGWTSPDDGAEWPFHVAKPRFFRFELVYATASGVENTEVDVIIDERIKACSLRSSGGLDRFISDTYIVAVPQSGQHALTIRPRTQAGSRWLVVNSVRFIPVRANLTPGEP